MSNQIVISSGAKVRDLNGVLTGTSGIVSSVPLGAANGVATLDSGGKVPVSQLPSSVVTYLGTWNAATNTPTLVNGTGDAGDMYICNVAGTVNFGAGPVTFAVGDWVLYGSGTWQKSNGQNGTVTSVAVTESGDALTITGSPITTAGTINIGFAGTSGQYVNGAGGLTTFPSLTGFVPYTGATGDVNLGLFSIISNRVSAIGDNSTYGGTLSIKQNNVRSLLGTGYTELFGKTNILGISFGVGSIANLSNSVLTAERTFTLPDLSGTLALLEGTQTFTGAKTFGSSVSINTGGQADLSIVSSAGNSSNINSFVGGVLKSTISTSATEFKLISAIDNILKFQSSTNFRASLIFSNSADYNYTFPAASGTIALTSNLSSYVPYTGATTNVDLGVRNLSSFGINVNGDGTGGGALNLKNYNSISHGGVGYTSIFAQSSDRVVFNLNDALGTKYVAFLFGNLGWNSQRYYGLPNADGTLALTSDLGAYLPLAGGTLTGALIGTTATFSGTVSSIVTSGGTSFRVVNSVNSRAWSLVPSTNGAESDLWLYYGGTGTGTKVSFVNNGNVLIGSTTDSGELLQVNGTSKFTGALSGTTGSFASSGGSDTFAINHSSGSGIALNITKGGNGEGLYINKTSGSGNALTVIGSTSLTGALSGTSATFSSSVKSDGGASEGKFIIERDSVGTNTIVGSLDFTNNNAATTYGKVFGGRNSAGDGYVALGTGISNNLYALESGNVGIGTTNPLYKLVVSNGGAEGLEIGVGYTSGRTLLQAYNRSGATYNAIDFAASSYNFTTGNVGIGTSSPTNGKLEIQTGSTAAGLWVQTGGTTSGFVIADFRTGTNLSALQILGNGAATFSTSVAVSDGTNSTTIIPTTVQIQTNGSSSTAAASAYLRLGDTLNGKFWALQIDASYQLATFHFSGGVWTKLGYQTTGGTWTNSDERRKENIELSNYGLNEVLQLIPKKFNFKIDERKIINLGFIAQDVLPIIPEAVQSDIDNEEEYYAMNYTNLVPVLVKAIQELKAELDELKNK
jgi:hypothetical protein